MQPKRRKVAHESTGSLDARSVGTTDGTLRSTVGGVGLGVDTHLRRGSGSGGTSSGRALDVGSASGSGSESLGGYDSRERQQ